MTTRSKSQTRSKNRASRRSRSSTQTRSQKGGNYGSFPDSAWGYQMNNLGNGWTQFMNSLSVKRILLDPRRRHSFSRYWLIVVLIFAHGIYEQVGLCLLPDIYHPRIIIVYSFF